jgi:hypothetical protein
MKGVPSAVGALVGVLVSSAALADGGESCDRALTIDGPPERVVELRAALNRTSLHTLADPTCAEALVSLRERDGGYSIALVIGGAHVNRDVTTIDAAATWVEGWLSVPPAELRPPATAAEPALEPRAPPRKAPERDSPVSPDPPRLIFVRPSAQVGLLATGAAGNDGSLWSGGELLGRLHMTPTLWFGGAVGLDADTALTGPAEEATRFTTRAALRVGARLPVARRLDAVLGVGFGVTWGNAFASFDGDDEDLDQGGGFVEAHADATYRVSSRFSLIGGFAARGRLLSRGEREDETERLMPDAMPPVTGELRLGAGWDFGGIR